MPLENHDHVLKRSHPIRLGEVVGEGEGVLYLGDGCMGMDARTVDPEERWYMARSASEPHFWMAELSGEGSVFRAFDEEGRLLDLVTTGEVETPPEAESVELELDRVIEESADAAALPAPASRRVVAPVYAESRRGRFSQPKANPPLLRGPRLPPVAQVAVAPVQHFGYDM